MSGSWMARQTSLWPSWAKRRQEADFNLWRHADPWFVLEMGVDDGIKRGLCLKS